LINVIGRVGNPSKITEAKKERLRGTKLKVQGGHLKHLTEHSQLPIKKTLCKKVAKATTPGVFNCWTIHIGNDPTAGSPTVTLLRLLLPLSDQV